MFQTVERKAKQTVRSLALSFAGGIMMAVGVGFLTVAAWIYLTVVADALTAASVIGAVYLGVGLITLGMARGGSDGHTTDQPNTAHAANQSTPENAPPIMQAFLHGMQAGANAKRH